MRKLSDKNIVRLKVRLMRERDYYINEFMRLTDADHAQAVAKYHALFNDLPDPVEDKPWTTAA